MKGLPCIHVEAGVCHLRRCWLRGCKRAKELKLTDGTGKLPGDRMCQAPATGFCEYHYPCEGACRKAAEDRHCQATGGLCEYILPCKVMCKKVVAAELGLPTEDQIIRTWLDYGYDGLPS